MKLPAKEIKRLVAHSRVDGNNVYGDCPWCGKNEFGISLDENHLFGCFRKKACGVTGNIFTLLTHLGISFKDESPSTKVDNKLEGLKSVEVDQVEIPAIELPVGYKRIYENEYLKDRGFTDFEKYEVGVTRIIPSLKGYVIFPIRQHNKVVGYVGRNTLDNDKPKYNNSKTDFQSTLWGVDEIKPTTTTIILVEGYFDKVSLDRYFKDVSDYITICCTFGAKFSKNQSNLILQPSDKTLIFMHERDVLQHTLKYAKKYSYKFEDIRVAKLPESEDPDTMDLESVLEAIEKSGSILVPQLI